MANVIGTGLVEKHDGEEVGYTIVHGLDSALALKADTEWLAFNLQVMTELQNIAKSKEELIALLTAHQFEDSHWSWLRKSVVSTGPEYEWFYYLAENQVQGICNIYHPKPSKIDAMDIFYVKYVAIAPWNRPNCLSPKKFGGIGTILIKVALTHAIDVLGYRPGFSLHSLPQAEGYYLKIGMKDFGPDAAEQNLHFFEMERETSERFAYA